MSRVFAMGERVKLPAYSNHRSLYPVRRDGVLFCFIGLPHGWGKRWQYVPLTLAEEPVPEGATVIDGCVPRYRNAVNFYGDGKEEALRRLQTGEARPVLHNDTFKDANELRQAQTDERADTLAAMERLLARESKEHLERSERYALLLNTANKVARLEEFTGPERNLISQLCQELCNSAVAAGKRVDVVRRKLEQLRAGEISTVTVGDLADEWRS